MDSPDVDGSAEAFDTLAGPIRIEILRALWNEAGQGSVSFSALRDAVDVGDSGRLNYHLQRLAGPFVEKVEDGYRLTPIGIAVVDTVYSGMLVPPQAIESTPIDERCPTCESRFVLSYDHGYMSVECEACASVLSKFLFPPRGVVARDSTEEIAAAFDARVRSAIGEAVAGVCPYCAGVTSFDSFAGLDDVPEGRVSLVATCTDCGGRVTASVGALASLEPSVVPFLHEHGVDHREPLWAQDWYHAIETTPVDGEPGVVHATIAVDGDRIRLAIDDAGHVERASP